jgi:predicted nucleotide-binding protein
MASSVEELTELATRFQNAAEGIGASEISEPLDALSRAAEALKPSFSGSWLGYHSRVFYVGLKPAPAGANFSQEWGLEQLPGTSLGSRGDWEEFDASAVKAHIYNKAGKPNLDKARAAGANAAKAFKAAKPEVLSILETELVSGPDGFLSKLKEDLGGLDPISVTEVLERWRPKGQIMTRDMVAMGQGQQSPPHLDVLADVAAIRLSFSACNYASEICSKAASHLERRRRSKKRDERVGTNVFIGHGRSAEWRKLKDFVQDRLRLPWDEFNRVPVAGITNIARLTEMLDAAAVAFVILTAEDEMADGELRARMNVIHEVGLFQGRLGFTKAIVLLEEGCAQFTNIEGLGQIRFPKGNIAAAFEEIRQVLEREGILSDAHPF